MMFAAIALLAGLALLVWSADRFVDGATATARHFSVPPLLIGMIIIGFGTSAPEMVVSALASWQGNPGIALGNAYGSNITNIALIIGITALINPIAVHSQVLRKELPLLIAVTLFAAWQLWDGNLSRLDGMALLGAFAAIMGWTIWLGRKNQSDTFGNEMAAELEQQSLPIRQAVMWLVVGLLMLIASSRLVVWGAVEIATTLGVSDLIIGLTVVAIGTSLPELASSLIAARKGEHDLALGNIIGSNLFNTLAVVGIAATISPMAVSAEILSRDIAVMATLTLILFAFCYGFRGPGRINRAEGVVLLSIFVAYTSYLIISVVTN
jgi:cation:H+ antiporter